MKYKLFLILILNIQYTFGQQFKVLEKSNLDLDGQNSKFIFISEDTLLDQNTFVASFRVEGILKHMLPLYYQIKKKAQNFGANSFKFRSYRKLENEKAELIIETYFNDELFLEKNALSIPRNRVFIFGKPNFPDGKTQTLKINDDELKIASGKFIERELSRELKISKGGITGFSISISPNLSGLPLFFIVSGSGISGGGYSTNTVGLNLSSGGIEQLEDGLGLLLLKVFEMN